MITRLLYPEEQAAYDSVVKHPVQTWAWGEFEKTQGRKIYRLGVFEGEKIVDGYTLSFNKLPYLGYSIGRCWRGPIINHELISNVKKICQEENAIFFKLEPNVVDCTYDDLGQKHPLFPKIDLSEVRSSPKVNFFPYSFIQDISPTEDELLAKMHPKTRYNIRLANRHGVEVREMSTDQGFEIYLQLLWETTARNDFYLHTPAYHRLLWKTMKNTRIMHVLIAYYQGKPIAAVIPMTVSNRLYYAYASSTDQHREVMAPTLAMWETIRLGKKLGCTTFDTWGSLGPNAKEYEKEFGFHQFKQRFGGTLSQFVGSFDYVANPNLYQLYNTLDSWRWKLLRLKAKIRHV